MSPFDLSAILLCFAALLGWVNLRLIGLPHTIGVLVLALLTSAGMIAAHHFVPALAFPESAAQLVAQIDFSAFVNAALGFLLFAGALQVDYSALSAQRWPIVIMATCGVVLSTAIIASGFYVVATWFGRPLPFLWCLVLGAIISPTDPIAVMSTLRNTPLTPRIQATIEGESLFNDGFAIVLFTLLVAAASSPEPNALHPSQFALRILREAGGGAALGLATGYIAYRALYLIDEYGVEVLITIALVTGTYALAQHLEVSGPIAVVIAGLLVGNRGSRYAMSENTAGKLFPFWTLIDEILNSVLFLLIGLELLLITIDGPLAAIGASVLPLVLLARALSVALPALAVSLVRPVSHRAVAIMTWAGVRGGISVALALSLPDSDVKPPILTATYFTAIFTIIAQGLTLPFVVRRLGLADEPPE